MRGDDVRDGLTVLWFKVESAMASHRKTRLIPRDRVEVPLRTAAMGAWWFAASWTAQNETDGFIPAEEIERFDPDGILAPWLVDVGYFETATVGGERGFILHDWLDVQESKADLDAARAAEAERKRKSRAANRVFYADTRGDSPPDDDGPGGGRPGDVQDALPGVIPAGVPAGHRNGRPSGVRPDGGRTSGRTADGTPDGTPAVVRSIEKRREELTTSATASPADTPRGRDYPPEFEAWWKLYPQNRGSKAEALKAWTAARKRASVETLTAGVMAYARTRKGEPPNFTRHASRWLRNDGWTDDLPRRGRPERRDPRSGRMVEYG